MSLDFTPIFVIGAARSGTKLLRDLIAHHPDIDLVPYDVNYIWRLGNESLPHDELAVEHAGPEVVQQIRTLLGKYHRGAPYLVEKTVSNTLRVDYLDRIYPNAYYVHLIRDGWDVVESVERQWRARPDPAYLLRKARDFPWRQAPGYAARYAAGLVLRLLGRADRSTSTWGPRYAGIDADLGRLSLAEVCARQWARCVSLALAGLAEINSERVLTLRYEDLVQEPEGILLEFAHAVGIDDAPYRSPVLLRHVSTDNLGKGHRRLSSETVRMLAPIIDPIMDAIAYDRSSTS